MQSIDTTEMNVPLKSAKVLVGQDPGCKNGLGYTTASIYAVKMSGSRTKLASCQPCNVARYASNATYISDTLMLTRH